MSRRWRLCGAVSLLLCLVSAPGLAQQRTLSGVVRDAYGAPVAGAVVRALHGGVAVQASTDADGHYSIAGLDAGPYRLHVEAEGFEAVDREGAGGSGSEADVDVVLDVGRVRQQVVVTAQADGVSSVTAAAPVSVIDRATITSLHASDLPDVLALIPGATAVQSGQRGAPTSLFVRGGNSTFNKVLMDGVPANDIGGAVEVADMAMTGVAQVEVLRESNSVKYGSDALAGVVSLTTIRGQGSVPSLDVTGAAGRFGAREAEASLGGALGRVDYFGAYGAVRTDNQTPNSDMRRATAAGRVSALLGSRSLAWATYRHVYGHQGSPNGFGFYGIADDSRTTRSGGYVSGHVETRLTERWQASGQLSRSDARNRTTNPSPTGTPFDPFGFGANYLGLPVTLTGANGLAVSGRAILDYSGSYPTVYRNRTTRWQALGQTTVRVADRVDVTGGGRVEREAAFSNPSGAPIATRNNGGGFIEGHVDLASRLWATLGLGVEHHAVFGTVAVPRAAVAFFVRRPATGTGWGDTKLVFNAGEGIKAPSVFQQQNALATLVDPSRGLVVPAVGPERGRDIDMGVEQWWRRNAMHGRVAYFRNAYRDLLEYLTRTQLPQAGVPAATAAAAQYGAYVNASSYTARGLEASFDARAGDRLRVSGSYTYLQATVTRALSATPVFNPAFPGVPIGAYAPLVGARPFRRPTHSGSVLATLHARATQVSAAVALVGARDDSTYLSDGFFGNSLLLPNRNLSPGYVRLDLALDQAVAQRVWGYVRVDNALDRPYAPAYGYPALPIAVRVGLRVSVGGRQGAP